MKATMVVFCLKPHLFAKTNERLLAGYVQHTQTTCSYAKSSFLSEAREHTNLNLRSLEFKPNLLSLTSKNWSLIYARPFNMSTKISNNIRDFSSSTGQTSASDGVQSKAKESANEQEDKNKKQTKKKSKFSVFYAQYGPAFLVIHLTTVVLWIYGFFLVSKQYAIAFRI
jgi:hypothetical protein